MTTIVLNPSEVRRLLPMNEAGDFLTPRSEGAIDDDHIVAEIGDVIVGRSAGRELPDELTLFKSLGLAAEDLAAAQHVLEGARRSGAGTTVELGGLRDGPD